MAEGVKAKKGTKKTGRRQSDRRPEVEKEYDLWARVLATEEGEARAGAVILTEPADLDSSWTTELVCHASISGKYVSFFSLLLKT